MDDFLQKDRSRSVPFGGDFIRLALIKVTNKWYKFVWVIHHALTDAWCMERFFSDLVKAYHNYQLPQRPSYNHYIKYILSQDIPTCQKFWREYLNDAHLTEFPASANDFTNRRTNQSV